MDRWKFLSSVFEHNNKISVRIIDYKQVFGKILNKIFWLSRNFFWYCWMKNFLGEFLKKSSNLFIIFYIIANDFSIKLYWFVTVKLLNISIFTLFFYNFIYIFYINYFFFDLFAKISSSLILYLSARWWLHKN